MQRVGLLNGKNITYDFDLTLGINEVVFSGIVNGFDIIDVFGTKYIGPGKAIIEIIKTTGEKVLCGFENTENVEVNTTGTRKIFVKFDELKINDGSNNNTNGTGIAEIVYNETAFPAQNYLALYSITSGVLTDLRTQIFLKPKKRKDFTPGTQRILLIDENGDENELAPGTNGQTIFCQDGTFYFDDINIVIPDTNVLKQSFVSGGITAGKKGVLINQDEDYIFILGNSNPLLSISVISTKNITKDIVISGTVNTTGSFQTLYFIIKNPGGTIVATSNTYTSGGTGNNIPFTLTFNSVNLPGLLSGAYSLEYVNPIYMGASLTLNTGAKINYTINGDGNVYSSSNAFTGITDGNSSTSGQSIKLDIEGISGGFTGIVKGRNYYLQNDGSISDTVSNLKIGIGVSSTEILITRQKPKNFVQYIPFDPNSASSGTLLTINHNYGIKARRIKAKILKQNFVVIPTQMPVMDGIESIYEEGNLVIGTSILYTNGSGFYILPGTRFVYLASTGTSGSLKYSYIDVTTNNTQKTELTYTIFTGTSGGTFPLIQGIIFELEF